MFVFNNFKQYLLCILNKIFNMNKIPCRADIYIILNLRIYFNHLDKYFPKCYYMYSGRDIPQTRKNKRDKIGGTLW